jgi:hypothetical protein
MFSSFGSTGESRRAIFLRRSQGIVGSATTTISGPVVRAAKFSRPWRPADAAEGGPSVMVRFDLPDGRVVLAEIAARLYGMTGRMIGARYPIED